MEAGEEDRRPPAQGVGHAGPAVLLQVRPGRCVLGDAGGRERAPAALAGAGRVAGDAGLEAGDAPGMDGSAMPAACASSRAAAAFVASMGPRFSPGESPSISWSMISSIPSPFLRC